MPVAWEVERKSPSKNPLGSTLKISMKKRVTEEREPEDLAIESFPPHLNLLGIWCLGLAAFLLVSY
jgi:hypothetical protein